MTGSRRLAVGATLAAAALGGAGLTAAAVAASGSKVAVVAGKPGEFSFVPKGTPTAGRVTFTVANRGKLVHEMVVIRTNTAPGRLSTDKRGLASEKGAVGETGDVKAGATKTITLTLRKGAYALICNLPGHYKGGMYAGLRVR
jgi:uncharacterized cupredoxin-like copper-binding protein